MCSSNAVTAGRSRVAHARRSSSSAIHEELALRDAKRQDVHDVVVRDGVLVARPRDEAVDAAHAIDSARRVIGMTRQRNQACFSSAKRSSAVRL